MTDRQGIEIDFCPDCRGGWLDRGELDKIIERSVSNMARQRVPEPRHFEEDRAYRKGEDHGSHGKRGYRRRSWLHDLFD